MAARANALRDPGGGMETGSRVWRAQHDVHATTMPRSLPLWLPRVPRGGGGAPPGRGLNIYGYKHPTIRSNSKVKRASFQALVSIGLIGCASGGAPAPASAPVGGAVPGAAPVHHMPELPATAGQGFTVADVRFMQDMIGHHAQAILMAAMAPTHGASNNVLRLAQKIDISQRDEIVMMKEWLRDRKQAVPDDAHAHMMMMPGMLTPEQMAQLDASRSSDFDRHFLTFMIQHHQGALQMVEKLFKSPGAAQESDIFRFATDVDADQRDEIFVMNKMLDSIREDLLR